MALFLMYFYLGDSAEVMVRMEKYSMDWSVIVKLVLGKGTVRTEMIKDSRWFRFVLIGLSPWLKITKW
ncbi:hypothetical protein CW304_10290 [Bacillus sp. UFRGS-B20]|nr:hypothetical protein CW304_10290 [Bacillus sp. UFRGS-B20]